MEVLEEKIPLSFFTEKYEKTNMISRYLIKNFLSTVTSLFPPDARTALDVGCGPGFSTDQLSKSFEPGKFFASDMDEDHVRLHRETYPNIPVQVESIYHLDRKNSEFDIVFALEVFEHLEEPERALVELDRVSSKYVMISVPNEPVWRILNFLRGKYLKDFGNTPGHINHWSQWAVSSLVATKFRVLKVATPLPWTVVLAEKRQHR